MYNFYHLISDREIKVMKLIVAFHCIIAPVKIIPFFCQWPYGDICSISPVGKGQGTEFNLTFRKGSGRKSETLKFSTEHRTELLTEALVRAVPW